MKKTLSFALIAIVLAAGSATAQDLSRAQIQQLLKIDSPAEKTKQAALPFHLLPPQTKTDNASATQSTGTSHKKRNVIIAVVVGGVAAGVIIAAKNGAYGSSNNGTNTGY